MFYESKITENLIMIKCLLHYARYSQLSMDLLCTNSRERQREKKY